jgi:transposase
MTNNTIKKRKPSKLKMKAGLPKHLQHINKMAAGIDVGSKSHFVAVPEGCADICVREFRSFTTDLHALADWLESCGITTIAMESTGVYWIPLYELLESRGFEVLLVDARRVKNVSGRKTDVLDCQWLQELHTYGLLAGAFRPKEDVCVLRVYMRQRHMLLGQMSSHIQHMQKALSQMNIQLHNVLSDITGESGMNIIRAIVSGVQDPIELASYRDYRCKSSLETIQKSLTGNYREEHVFTLSQALDLFDVYQSKIAACDDQMEKHLSTFEGYNEDIAKNLEKKKPRQSKNAPLFDIHTHLFRMVGVDLTLIPGIEAYSALKILSEIGLDLNRWRSGKQFASWLGLCPGNKVSGGKRLSSKSKRTSNYAAFALRMAASTLHRSQTALGAFLRRMKARIGAPKAITATAHKLALIIYNMLTKRTEYVETGAEYYEHKYRKQLIKSLTSRAKKLGFNLIEIVSEFNELKSCS